MADISNPEAIAIVEDMLEQTRLAAFSRDFGLFSRWVALPNTVTTFETTRTIETMAEMEAVFLGQCENFANLQVTDMVRRCKSAVFDGPDCIHATHNTHLMSKDRRIQAPYPVFIILVRREGKWRVEKSDYAVAAGSGFERAIGKTPPSSLKSGQETE